MNESSYIDLSSITSANVDLISSLMSTVSLISPRSPRSDSSMPSPTSRSSVTSPRKHPPTSVSRSRISERVMSFNKGEPIPWKDDLPNAIKEDNSLTFIRDLCSHEISEDNTSNLLEEIENISANSFNSPIEVQENLFLFVTAKKTLAGAIHSTQMAPQNTLLRASYLFFRIQEDLLCEDDDDFDIKTFLDSAKDLLSISKEEAARLFVLYIKNCISTSNTKALQLLNASIYECCQIEKLVDWIAIFLQPEEGLDSDATPLYKVFVPAFSDELSKLSKGRFSCEVYQRYIQITQMRTDLWCSENYEADIDYLYYALCLAYYMVKHKPPTFCLINSYIKNREFPHCKVQYDNITGDIYLLSQKKKTVAEDQKGKTKIGEAIRLPFSAMEAPVVASQTVNYDLNDIVELRESAQVRERFTGTRGICPMLTSCTYLTSKQTPTISLLTPLTRSLFEIGGEEPLSIQDLLPIIEDLAYGLDCLHSNGLIHGAIDAKCVHIRALENEQVAAGWVDFRRSRSPHSNLFQDGYYGSHLYTPPELFGSTDRHTEIDVNSEEHIIDPYAADIWAFGQLLFELCKKTIAPWSVIIGEYTSQNNQNDQDLVRARERFLKLFAQHVGEPSIELTQKKRTTGLTLDEEVYGLIYNMLNLHPKARPKIKTIKEAIATIKMSHL